MLEENFRYYAFISYSHKDRKAANWIHKRLTFYRLPSYARKELHRNIRIDPICKDNHSLPPGPLWEMLKEKLNESKFLIVVCSPNSARPGLSNEHWVNREVEYFAETHGIGRIIPIIVDGKIDGGDEECFCPALKKYNILALDATSKENSKEKILNFLAAKLLGLNANMLYSYAQEEMKKRRKLRFFFLLPLLILAMLAGFLYWDSTRTVNMYYADYVDSYGLPEGIFELTPEELRVRSDHYRFEYRGYRWGKAVHADSAGFSLCNIFNFQRILQKVVHENSAGVPETVNHTELSERPAIQEFTYDAIPFFSRKLREIYCKNPGHWNNVRVSASRITFADHKGVINGSKNFMEKDGDKTVRQSATTDKSSQSEVSWNEKTSQVTGEYITRDLAGRAITDETKTSQVTGEYITRDLAGRAITETYKNANGTAAPDKDGIYGKKYVLDDLGRVIVVSYLDKDGRWQENGKGVAGKKYRYTQHYLWRAEYVNKDGDTVIGPHGWMIAEDILDPVTGNTVGGIYKNPDDSLFTTKKGYAGYILELDERGLLRKQTYHGIKKNSDGSWKPVMSTDGYAIINVVYEDGYLTEITFADTEGDPCCDNGIAGITRKYRDGNLWKETYIDLDKNPVADTYGVVSREYDYYPASGNLKEVAIFGDKDDPAPFGATGVYKQLQEYNEYGKPLTETYTKYDGTPAADSNGIHNVVNKYDDDGNLIADELFALPDKGGIWGYENVHCIKRTWENGNTKEEYYFDSDGNKATDGNGVHKVVNEYDSDGNLIADELFALPDKGGIWGYENVHHVKRTLENGNIKEEYYFDSDGNKVTDGNGVHKVVNEYDSDGNLIADELFALPDQGGIWGYENVHCVKRTWANGNITSQEYYAPDNTPAADSDGNWRGEVLYDEDGNMSERIGYALPDKGGIDGNPGIFVRKDKFAVINGISCTLSTEYYGKNNVPAVTADGIHRELNSYDDNGNLLADELFALPDQGGIWGNSNVHHVKRTWENGNIKEEYYFDSDVNKVTDGNGVHKVVNEYDSDGNLLAKELFALPDQGGIWGYENVHCVKRTWENGNIKEEYYLGIDDNKVVNDNGIHKVVNEYDSDGNLLADELFALPDQGGIWGNSNVHCVKRTWENGNVTSEEYYAPDGTPAADNNGVTEKKFRYKKNGLRLDKYFYADGRTEVLKMKNLVKAAIVLSDSPGAAKGVQAGDLILNFAGVDWTTGDFSRNIVAETAETEKTLIFARKQEDGSFIIFEHTFPAGRIGLHMMDFWGEMAEYGQVLEDYKEFMTEG